MKKLLTTLLGLALFSTIVGYTSDALAYVSLKCDGKRVKWPNSPVTMRASQVGFPVGNGYREALTEAINLFYQNPSNFWYTLTYDDPLVGVGNGETEAWWTGDPNLTNTARAFTQYNCSSASIYEADAVFYNGESYTSSTNDKRSLWPYGGGFRPFQTTAIHELGHTVGLEHEGDEYNVMGFDFTHIYANGTKATAYLGEDAAYGIAQIYGYYPGSYEDISVTHWKYANYASDGYSVHDRTRILDSNGNLLSSYIDTGEPRYIVNRGQTVQVEFTYENNGTNKQNTTADLYVSTNDYISRTDTWLTQYFPTIDRGNVNTFPYSVSIPNNLTPGKYYIGVLLDGARQLSEMREDNNATYIGIEVR
ncbi:matrixin family metalloprotease [Nostoc sp. FACHB-280]|uniref:matrixin family metalloprotease n=1 Tax=Nostoc sp. FACHB-280 TaxID=2692839 RepID=UPI00168BA15D|nr:matrixin family metalloprotease [Nostoc sp. FACHB-280]MBD2497921.1 matrixin family metalloprotease [Nostoc sp. FACHB-280]